MKTLDLATLAGVHGGMRWEDFRQSTNVEDYRHRKPPRRPAPVSPLPRLVRTPGDLSSQAGLDDIGRHGRRRR